MHTKNNDSYILPPIQCWSHNIDPYILPSILCRAHNIDPYILPPILYGSHNIDPYFLPAILCGAHNDPYILFLVNRHVWFGHGMYIVHCCLHQLWTHTCGTTPLQYSTEKNWLVLDTLRYLVSRKHWHVETQVSYYYLSFLIFVVWWIVDSENIIINTTCTNTYSHK